MLGKWLQETTVTRKLLLSKRYFKLIDNTRDTHIHLRGAIQALLYIAQADLIRKTHTQENELDDTHCDSSHSGVRVHIF